MIVYSSGYAVESGDYPLTHARMGHSGNWTNPNAFYHSSTDPDYGADQAANTLTYERWKPTAIPGYYREGYAAASEFDYCAIAAHTLGASGCYFAVQRYGALHSNLALYSQEFDNAAWAKTSATVTANSTMAPDGTMTADTLTVSILNVSQGIAEATTFTPDGVSSYTASLYVKRDRSANIQLLFRSTITSGTEYAVLTVNPATAAASWSAAGASGGSYAVEEVGTEWLRISTTADALPVVGLRMCIRMVSLPVAITFKIWGAQREVSTAAKSYVPTTSATASTYWYNVTNWELAEDNQPIFCMFAPVTASLMGVSITAGSAPEIGVIKFGKALQLDRPIFAGQRPPPFNVLTEYGNQDSESGEFLGRTIRRRATETSYAWQHISGDWVRANWEAAQRAFETDPVFIAWRPGTFGNVEYGTVTGQTTPEFSGLAGLMNLGVSVRGYYGS